MAAVATPDVSVVTAFAMGMVSFLSPCVLPLVPGYLSAISGVPFTELRRQHARWQLLRSALGFSLTFSFVFICLGLTATALGTALQLHRDALTHVAGAAIVAMGSVMLLAPFTRVLNAEWRPNALIARAGSGGPLIAGAAFAIAWTPCVGPTLGAILSTAATGTSAGQGAVLLACYSAGLAVPFLASAFAFEAVMSSLSHAKRHTRALTAGAGVVLIGYGALMATGELTRLNAEAQRLLGGSWLGAG